MVAGPRLSLEGAACDFQLNSDNTTELQNKETFQVPTVWHLSLEVVLRLSKIRALIRMATYEIVMIRHGESTWNKENKFCGW